MILRTNGTSARLERATRGLLPTYVRTLGTPMVSVAPIRSTLRRIPYTAKHTRMLEATLAQDRLRRRGPTIHKGSLTRI